MSLSVWQDGIPPEILCEIFAFAASAAPVSIDLTLPLDVSGYPWVLGSICSIWRRVSRSKPMANSWRATITMQVVEITTGEGQQPKLSFDSDSFCQLQCAANLFPAGGGILLHTRPVVTVSDGISVSPSFILEYFPLVYEMSWNVFFDPALFPPKSLVRLERLSIDSYHNSVYTTAPLSLEHFGDSPKLQTLSIRNPTPHLIKSGIPWSCLRSLNLDAKHQYTLPKQVDGITLAWRDFFETRAITDLSCLRELTLGFQSELLGIFLTADFPWLQLTSLRLFIDGTVPLDSDLSLLSSPLRLSSNLVHLLIHWNDSFQSAPIVYRQEQHPITFPLLQHFSIGGPIPLSMFGLSGILTSFKAELGISLWDFYSIVRQCTGLTRLMVLLTPSTHPSASSGLIVLSYLRSLNLSFNEEVQGWSPASFPTLLVLPALTSFTLQVSGSDVFPFNFAVDLINRSNAKLSYAIFSLEDPTSLAPQPEETILPLLMAVNSAMTVLTRGLVFPQAVLDALAAGSLLPYVEHFEFSVSFLEQFLSTINARLRHEETCGSVNLQMIGGYVIPVGLAEDDIECEEDTSLPILRMAAQKLSRRYGIECDLDYLYPFSL